ncbi:MAG: hypothetical protein GY906_11760 [bacterium]|nr:hypothetical protein [bacterium]
MALQIHEWTAQFACRAGKIYLPFDFQFNGRDKSNRIVLSRVGSSPSWHVFVSFAGPLAPNHVDYPRYARVEDNDDFAILQFNCTWANKAGVQYGVPGSQGPIPTQAGKRQIRLTLLNSAQQPLAAQSGVYFIDPG